MIPSWRRARAFVDHERPLHPRRGARPGSSRSGRGRCSPGVVRPARPTMRLGYCCACSSAVEAIHRGNNTALSTRDRYASWLPLLRSVCHAPAVFRSRRLFAKRRKRIILSLRRRSETHALDSDPPPSFFLACTRIRACCRRPGPRAPSAGSSCLIAGRRHRPVCSPALPVRSRSLKQSIHRGQPPRRERATSGLCGGQVGAGRLYLSRQPQIAIASTRACTKNLHYNA